MDLFQAVVLALIQGLTEFIPVSSSAHLILPAQLLQWPDQGLAYDVAVHFGSLLAVIIYFRRDLRAMTHAWFGRLLGDHSPALRADAQLAWMTLMATLPALVVAGLCNDLIAQNLRSTVVIACATIAFGLLLGVAEWHSRRSSPIAITWFIAMAVGLAQVLALVPGTSRSGITITVAVLLGLSRTDAARFSFLLSIPLIAAATLFELTELVAARISYSWSTLLIGLCVSGVSAYACIGVFLRLLERVGFMPFVWYRLALGIALLTML